MGNMVTECAIKEVKVSKLFLPTQTVNNELILQKERELQMDMVITRPKN